MWAYILFTSDLIDIPLSDMLATKRNLVIVTVINWAGYMRMRIQINADLKWTCPNCVYTVNHRSTIVSVLHVAFVVATLMQLNF